MEHDYLDPKMFKIVPSKKIGLGKAIVATVLILVLGAVAIVSILRDRIVNYPQNQVSVSGQGKVFYQADIANITLGVQIDKVAKADEALNQLNVRIDKIITALKKAGVAAEDIQTQNYSLYPQYDYINDVSASPVATSTGYNANQQLVVKVRGIDKQADKPAKVLAEASRAGANQILGISFEVSNLEELKQQARIKAIADARSKAGKMAEAANINLGEIVGWWENLVQAPGQPMPYYDGKGGMGAGVSMTPTIPTGSSEVIMEISLSYKIK